MTMLGLSLIPNSGNGIFATKDFVKGETIGEYFGKIYKLGGQIPKLYQDYAYETLSGNVVCPEESCLLRYINDAIDLEMCLEDCADEISEFIELRGFVDMKTLEMFAVDCLIPSPKYFYHDTSSNIFCGYNVDWIETDDRVFVVATRDIPKGSELYIDYGWRYWINKLVKLVFEKIQENKTTN